MRFAAMTPLALCLALALASADWPQFQGPQRDNRSRERGLLDAWPVGGPPLVWKAAGLGEGFASVAIADGKIFTAGNLDGKTMVFCLDMDGKLRWQAANGPAYDKAFPGTRSTPTLDGERLYHLNPDGRLACLETASGRPRWAVDLVEQFGGRRPTWGCAESPLVDGGRVVVSPGGEKIAMVAFDKHSGQVVWQCRGKGDPPSYASAILVDYGGLRQIVTMTADAAMGVAAESGDFLWRYEWESPYDVHAASPVYQDGCIAISTTWGRGTVKLRLHVAGKTCTVERLWHSREFDNEHGGMVLLDGHLYGLADNNHKKRRWACLDWQSGTVRWQSEPIPGTSATLTYADGRLYLVTDRGEVLLQRPTPERFDVVGRFDLPKGGEGRVWARPVVCGGRFYIRHGQFLYCYDVRRASP